MRRKTLVITVTALAMVSIVVFVVVQNSAECSGPTLPATDSPNATFEATADGYTLRVVGDEEFYMGALGWFLRIGDVDFSWGRYPGTTLQTIAFDVPSEALQHLKDGDPITVNYGNPRAVPFAVNPDSSALPSDSIARYIAASCGRDG